MTIKAIAAIALSSPFWLSASVREVKLTGEIRLPPGNLISFNEEKFNTKQSKEVRSRGIIYNSPLFDPPDGGTSPTTSGGGTRGPSFSCLKNNQSIVPLMPKNKFELTLSQYPKLFVYIPESTAQQVRLVVRGVNEDYPLYDTTLNISSKPGIVPLSLPTEAALPPLKEGKIYHWELFLVCNTTDVTKNGKADGWIKRIKPSDTLRDNIEQTSLSDRPRVYGQAGIWQETLTTLAELRSASPNDLALVRDWENLLRSVGLEAVAQQPLVFNQQVQNKYRSKEKSKREAQLTLAAKPPEKQESKAVQSKEAIFEPPDGGATPSTAGGGTRGRSCLSKGKSIIPLIPTNNLVLTVSEYPTFYSYIPESTAKTAKFILQEYGQDDQAVYETTFNIPNQSGIVSVGLPQTTLPPLKVGKMYRWFFIVECDPEDSFQNPVVEGWIKRIEPSTTLLSELKKTSARNQLRVYGKAGIWQDTLTTLVQLRRDYPQDAALATDWENLLKSVGLDAVVEEPLILEREIPK